jgi:hypothetical protein
MPNPNIMDGAGEAPLINELFADDLSQPTPVRIYTGFLGPSRRAGKTYWRLYLNLHATSYIEVAEDAIVYRSYVDDDKTNPLQLTVLWVRRDADIRTGRFATQMTDEDLPPQRPQQSTDFLNGSILGLVLPQLTMQGLNAGTMALQGDGASRTAPPRQPILSSPLGGGGCDSSASAQCPH